MTAHVRELLPELVTGSLEDERAEEVAAHLATCRECAAELEDLTAAFAELALALPGAPPPPALRERVLASVAAGGRFADWVGRVAALVDLAADAVGALLDSIDRAASWSPGPVEGTAIIHFEGGPACAGCVTGFVRVEPGVLFPTHKHLGEERVLILQGAYTDDDGTVYRRGEVAVKEAGSSHSYRALADGPPLVFAVRIVQGIEMDGFEV